MTQNTYPLTIKQWADEDRPREKMIAQGAQQLTNAELLALIIGSGIPGTPAVQLMQRLLIESNQKLKKLQQMSVEELMLVKGIGVAKAVKIKAALTLALRMDREKNNANDPIQSSKQVYNMLKSELAFLGHEEFWVVYLNQSNRVLKKHCLSKGSITQTVVDVRLALKNALQSGATALILAHNHPSGGLHPSRSDREVTKRFKSAAALFDIRILDHIILSEKGYFSFLDHKAL